MNFRFFYLWLRSSTVLPYSLSKNRMFIERCLARRKLFSSYSNLIQNSLWTSTQHPLFSKGQFRLFKFQFRRTFVRILFIIIFYCLAYGTYVYLSQSASLWSRFYFLIPLLQLFYLLLVDILFVVFFSLFNWTVYLSETLHFSFLKSFVLYLKQLILHRTFLFTANPIKDFNDPIIPKATLQTNVVSVKPRNELFRDLYRLKSFLGFELKPLSGDQAVCYPQNLSRDEDLYSIFSIEYNLGSRLNFCFKSNSLFNDFWSYYCDLVYKKHVNFSLIYHWLLTNPIISYSDLRLASESLALFSAPRPLNYDSTSLDMNNLPAFHAFKYSIVSLLSRQSLFFQNSLFFKLQNLRQFRDVELRPISWDFTSLSPLHPLSAFINYLNLLDKNKLFCNLQDIAYGDWLLNKTGQPLHSTGLHALNYIPYSSQAYTSYITSNIKTYTFTLNTLFDDSSCIFSEFTVFPYNRTPRLYTNYLS